MKHILAVALVLLFVLTLPAFSQLDRVVVSFTSQNAYGNNLYIDNFSIGTQYGTDVAVVSINNIKPDTSYAIGSSGTVVAPRASLINLGLSNITTPFNVTFTGTPGGYTSTRTINSLNKGQMQEVTFDNLTLPVSTAMNLRLISNLSGDQNRSNDTLRQYSIIFPGVQRTVLLEQWTSSTCAPCASNNPTVDAFIHSKFDSVVAIKYHVGWPSPGNDPMYLYNTTQSYDRRYYYGVNAVPHIWMDGVLTPSYPYSDPPSLPTAFGACTCVGAPISLSVTDTRIAGDTIRADVTLTILAPLRGGSYKMRVHAIQRKIHYTSPPGTNGETDFYDVFRRAYPNSDGTAIPTSVGTYNFTFKYPKDLAVWVDSMMYTAVFVQNDVTKEVINCAKARHVALANNMTLPSSDGSFATRERCVNAEQIKGSTQSSSFLDNPLSGVFKYELFEAATFPPSGWRLANPDNGITWAQFSSVSGPSFGGNVAVKMDFYGYGGSGQTDTLMTAAYTGLNGIDSLKFDWAYAQYQTENDRLVVKISKDGGATFPYTVFDRMGATLATAPATTSPFVPTNSSQWRTFSYSLGSILSSVGQENDLPRTFDLAQNYPNPFNPSTVIEYSIPRTTAVRLTVCDVLGREITTLVDGIETAGRHSVSFDSGEFASGLYFYRISAGEFSSIRKMMVLK